jgi:hypothetical protein
VEPVEPLEAPRRMPVPFAELLEPAVEPAVAPVEDAPEVPKPPLLVPPRCRREVLRLPWVAPAPVDCDGVEADAPAVVPLLEPVDWAAAGRAIANETAAASIN